MRFWPAIDPVQLEYERLREMALAGTRFIGPEAERFQHGGLVALIRRPGSTASRLIATLVEVPRPRGHRTSIPALTRWPTRMRCSEPSFEMQINSRR
jgi:hypothetical protein